MTHAAEISPTHSVIKTYYRDLKEIHAQGVANELSTRSPFFNLLSDTARLHGWTTVAEMALKAGGRNLGIQPRRASTASSTAPVSRDKRSQIDVHRIFRYR